MDQGLVTLSITAQRRLRQEGQDQAQDQLRLHRKSTKKKKKKDVCDHVIMERFFFSFKKKIYLFIRVHVLLARMYVYYVLTCCLPTEAKRCWIPRNWNSRWCDRPYWCLESNSGLFESNKRC